MSRVRFGVLIGGVVIASALATGAALAAQNHMFNARADLNSAYHQLNVALHNKAGHREKAMQLIQDAIAEVDAGIQAGR